MFKRAVPRSERDALSDGRVFHSDPDILGGTPVFVGTRVPVRSLIEHLEGGYTLDQYLDGFPSVRREQAVAFLEQAAEALLKRWREAHPAGTRVFRGEIRKVEP